MQFAKGGATLARTFTTLISVYGSACFSNVQVVNTTDTTLDLGGIGTIGYVIFNNLDGANFIDIGADGSSYPIRLQKGTQSGPLSWNGAAIHAKADTASCKLQYDIVEA